jgi:hypothetical protein
MKASVEVSVKKEITTIRDIPNFQILLSANVPTQAPQPAIIGPNVGSNSGGANETPTIEQINTKLENKEITYQCTVLRKVIKNSENPDQIDRVIFCADEKQVKSFSKRKTKHDKGAPRRPAIHGSGGKSITGRVT